MTLSKFLFEINKDIEFEFEFEFETVVQGFHEKDQFLQ